MSDDEELTPAQQRIIDACHRPTRKPFSYETQGDSREAILAWVRGEGQPEPEPAPGQSQRIRNAKA